MGLSGAEAFQELTAAGTTTEGYLAAAYGYRLAQRSIPEGEPVSRRYPVLDALYRILYEGAPRAKVCGARSGVHPVLFRRHDPPLPLRNPRPRLQRTLQRAAALRRRSS